MLLCRMLPRIARRYGTAALGRKRLGRPPKQRAAMGPGTGPPHLRSVDRESAHKNGNSTRAGLSMV
jgi:hypothetical protein